MSCAPADGTSLRLRSRFCTGAEACITILRTRNRNVAFFTKDSLFELDRHRVLQIITALRRVWIATTTAAPKEHIENITEAAEIRAGKSTAHPLVRINVAILVVASTFPRIAKDIVGLFDFFKLILRIRRLVHVRVILTRQLAIGFLNIIVRGALANPQHLIIIALFSHPSTPTIAIAMVNAR
ncbi:hypothetical protein D3C77_350430 [compost metagenome]